MEYAKDDCTRRLSHLGFRKVLPCRALADYVSCYWFIRASKNAHPGYQEFLHPDGGMGFIFNYGQSMRFDDSRDSFFSLLDGTNTRSRLLYLSGEIDAIGIRFKPSGAYAFLQIPLAELKNQNIALSGIPFKSFSEMYEPLAELTGIEKKVLFIEEQLTRMLQYGLGSSSELYYSNVSAQPSPSLTS